jgi:hypothetical protein
MISSCATPIKRKRAGLLLLALLFCGFLTQYANAQTVLQCTVTDRNTGDLVAGVSVFALCSNPTYCGAPKTTTDANGNYSLAGQQISNQSSGYLDFQGAVITSTRCSSRYRHHPREWTPPYCLVV